MLKAIVWSYIVSYGTILSIVGPGLSTGNYIGHGVVAMFPAWLIGVLYVYLKDTFEKAFFDAMAEDLINRK